MTRYTPPRFINKVIGSEWQLPSGQIVRVTEQDGLEVDVVYLRPDRKNVSKPPEARFRFSTLKRIARQVEFLTFEICLK